MSFTDFELILRRLGFHRPGEVFWLSSTPTIGDDEVRPHRAGR